MCTFIRRHFEGTGVLVLDRINGIAYVALSERADKQVAERWVNEMGYRCAQIGKALCKLTS